MKLKRAKAYKKLLHQYELNFGFREPYQVLLDSEILQDADRFKIDLVGRLHKVLGGQIKPMITTCDMRHLYNAKPKNETLIQQAKEYERRRCNHHDLDEPLSTLECLSSVVDAKGNNTNKHRYVVATNDPRVRAHMRHIAGVPLIYISKSVVLMEPMANVSEEQREREEKLKFKQGLKGGRKPSTGQKRKYAGDQEEAQGSEEIVMNDAGVDAQPSKKKRQYGPKEPNPLSVKKAKRDKSQGEQSASKKANPAETDRHPPNSADAVNVQDVNGSAPRKRKRKHKPKGDDGANADGESMNQ